MAASMYRDVVEKYDEFEFKDEFEYILDLLSDQGRVDAYLKMLSEDVQKRCMAIAAFEGGDRGILPADEDEIKGIVLHDILCETETAHGFSSQVWYLGGVLSTASFFEMMLDVHPFMDPLVNAKHGAQTHRIQWWMICKEIDKRRLITTAANASELYKATAHKNAQVKVGATSATTLWYKVFDNIQGGGDLGSETARCPEWLMQHIKENYTTYLKPAEIAAQIWNTAPKACSTKYRELRIAGFLSAKGNVKKKAK